MKTETRKLIRFDASGARSRFQSIDEGDEEQDGDVALCGDGSQRKLRVLVADDCRDAADSLCTLVTIWGHTVAVAYDGATALQIASSFQPDALLLDIAMPAMDGYQVARQLRHEECFRDTLLIAVTGWTDQSHRLLGEEAGFDLYLIKPVQPSTLEVLLALEQARLAHSAHAPVGTPRALAVAGNGQ